MIRKIQARVWGGIAGAILAGGLGWFFHWHPAGSFLTNASYDLLLVARGNVPVEGVVLVYMNERAHQELGQSTRAPWSRRLHAALIEHLKAAGAKAIVFDVVFDQPSERDPEEDQVLARALEASGRVILAADNIPVDEGMRQVRPPIDPLLDTMAGMGSAQVIPSRDLVIRRHTPRDQTFDLPGLSWAAAEFVKAPATLRKGEGERWMNYYGPANYLPWMGYHEALTPAVLTNGVFRDKVVFVGARILTKFAGERKDEYRTPYAIARDRGGIFIAGAEIQATGFLNVLRQDWLRRLSGRWEELLILIAGLGLGFGLVRVRPTVAILSGVAGAILIAVVSFLFFKFEFIWFPWLIIEASLAVALAWALVFNSIQLYVQKRLYEQTLSLYLSPKLVRKFSRNPTLLKPGAEKQMLTILFSDIANFTTIAEDMDSDDLATLMNHYFQSAVANCIHKTDGTVVKYIGDAIFAFWNAPEQHTDHEMRACLAALRFKEQSAEPINGHLLPTRIGLHTGIANVGNFGSTERVDYTAIGESVNMAARMESLNKHLGTHLLMSGETLAGVGDRLVSRFLGDLQLKGFEKTVRVHELLGGPEVAGETRSLRESFAAALGLFQEGKLREAKAAFGRVLEAHPDDGPSRFYLSRIARLEGTELPADWKGEVELEEK